MSAGDSQAVSGVGYAALLAVVWLAVKLGQRFGR